jgi:hypothetical protein
MTATGAGASGTECLIENFSLLDNDIAAFVVEALRLESGSL